MHAFSQQLTRVPGNALVPRPLSGVGGIRVFLIDLLKFFVFNYFEREGNGFFSSLIGLLVTTKVDKTLHPDGNKPLDGTKPNNKARVASRGGLAGGRDTCLPQASSLFGLWLNFE